MRILASIILLTFLLVKCKNNNLPKKNEKPIAQVYDKYLYYSDIKYLINYNAYNEDSQIIVDDYIKKWINQELLYNKAVKNLTEKELDVSHQIENYKTRLIINKYEQKIINQKLDTSFTDKEIKDYYTKFSDNFKLNETIVKAIITEIPRSAPNIWQIRKWLKSDKETDMDKAKVYIHDHAKKYKDFNGDWINKNILKSMIDIKSNRFDSYLNNRDFFEISDSTKIYLIKIDDKKNKGEISPLELVKNNITKILITKRKQELIERIEKEAYDDATEQQKIKLFNKTKLKN